MTPGLPLSLRFSGSRAGASVAPGGSAGLLLALPLLALLFGAAPEAFAQAIGGPYTVPSTWSLRPAGDPGGTGFRLLFVTSTRRDAGAQDISVYNRFVQSAAARGDAAITPYGAQFRALASTAQIDARDNTETTGTGVPIYWLNGDKVADDYVALYNDHVWDSFVRTDENGNAYAGDGNQYIWTGSLKNGQKHPTVFLGSSAGPKAGNLSPLPGNIIGPDPRPIEFSTQPRGSQYPLYALSPIFVADISDRTWVTPTALDLDEGRSTTYTVALNTDPGVDVTVTATPDDDSAVRVHAGGGAPAASVTLTFTHGSSGNWSAPQTVTVTAAEDADTDSEQNVRIAHAVSAASGPYASVSSDRVEVDVTDNDYIPAITFVSAVSSAGEAGGTHNVNVRLDRAAGAKIELAYTLSGTAARASDYEILGVTSDSGTLYIASGATAAAIPVAIADDFLVEGDESVVLTLQGAAAYTLGAATVHTLTIQDNDKPEISFGYASSSAGEAAGTRNLPANLNQAAVSDFTLAYTISGTATQGDDYEIAGATGNSGAVDVSVGDKTVEIPVAIVDDSAVEVSETVVLTLQGGAAYTLGAATVHTLTIQDNDKPAVSFASASSSASEAAGMRNVTANLDQAAVSDFTLAYTISGTATQGDDYEIAGATSNSGTVDVPAGATTAAIPVALVDDSVVEDSETVVLTLEAGARYTLGSPQAYTLTILDSETPRIVANPRTLNLKEGGDEGSYMLSLAAEPGGSVTVTPISSDADAVTVSAALQFDGSNWQDPQSVTVAPQDDMDADDENVTITHAVTGYGSLVSGPEVIVGVEDDETPMTAGVDVSVLTLSLAEGGANESYTVALRTDPGGAATVTPVSSDADAVAVSAALQFNSSNWREPQTVTVAPQDDTDADDENVTITHSVTGYGGVPNGPSIGVKVVDDDEPTAVASFASSSASMGEDAGAGGVTVNFSPALASDVTLRYAVTGTATKGKDYTMAHASSVDAPASATDATIPITIMDDAAEERDEMVVFTLQAGTGYEVGNPSTYTLVITDDDAPPAPPPVAPSAVSLSASPNPVMEGEEATVMVSLSQLVSRAVTIPLVLTAGTAEAGDYGALASIVIEANEPSGMGVIPTVADDDADDETFTVALGDLPDGVLAGSPSSVEITVMDSGGPTSAEEEIPAAFALEQNYPNPFNPATTIAFSLDKAQHATLTVYDLLGHEVRVLVDGVQPAARRVVSFDASDLASGTYIYVLRTEARTVAKTMALLK